MPNSIMPIAIWVAVEISAVTWLLTAIRRDRTRERWMAKPAASAVFVVFGLMRADIHSAFDLWMVAGLILGMAGDLLLIERQTFRWGLLTFLAGHAAYIVAFDRAQPWSTWSLVVLFPLVLAAGLVARWLWPHTSSMRAAVLAYIVIISLMAWGGIALSLSGALPVTAGIGATLFFLSDLAVARHRFVKESFINRALGLPAYYAGQMLLALTIGSVG
ncbi:MAG: lysoplasmalogenase [Acidobacteria bacterium]|nr:lysoplasmalogenase [Acidobacteriota bacterium]